MEEVHHRGAIVDAVVAARRYFPASTAREVVQLLGPSLTEMHSQSPFIGTALLLLFLPHPTAISDLSPGTAAGWLDVWATVEHCTAWDGLWAQIFTRLAEPRSLVDSEADAIVGAEGGDALAWGARLPFFFARLSGSLNLPVPGGESITTILPGGVENLLGRHMPDAESNLSLLAVQLLTIRVPKVLSVDFGDSPPLSPTAPPKVDGPRGTSATGAPLPPCTETPHPNTADASALGHIERILRVAVPLFHPAQPLFHVLLRLLSNLSTGIAKRAGREAGLRAAHALLTRANAPAPPCQQCPLPLDAALLTRVVDAILPLAAVGLYAAKGFAEISNEACRTLIALTPLAPARVTRELVMAARLALAFDCAPGASHLAPHVLSALAALTPNLLFPVPHIAFVLPELLEASLPGIDPNDATKTAAAAAFFSVIATSIAIVDEADAEKCPSIPTDANGAPRLPHWHPASATFTGLPLGTFVPPAIANAPGVLIAGGAVACLLDGTAGPSFASGIADILPDGRRVSTGSSAPEGAVETPIITDNDAARASALADPTVGDHFSAAHVATPLLGDWALQVIDRSLKVFEARDKPERRLSRRARAYAKKEAALADCVSSIIWAMSPTVRRRAVARVVAWVANSPPLACAKDLANILSAIGRVENLSGLPLTFGPLLIAAAAVPGASAEARTWAQSLLTGALNSVGAGVIPLVPSLIAVLSKAFEPGQETQVRKSAGKALKSALKSLLFQYCLDVRTHAPAAWAISGGLWADWAPAYSWTPPLPAAADFLPPAFVPLWHVSTAPERAAALDLLNAFLVPAMKRLTVGTQPAHLRSDLTIVMACTKGTSNVTPISVEGCDGIMGIAIGSLPETSLVWNEEVSKIEWASQNSPKIVPLRAALAIILTATASRFQAASTSGSGASIDTDAAKQLIKNAYAVLVIRAARVTKTLDFIASVRFDRGKTVLRVAAALAATRVFKRAARLMEPGPFPRSYTGCSIVGASSSGPRSLMALRTQGALFRRLCEAVNAVPRVAAGVRGVATLGAADPDIPANALTDAAIDAEFASGACDAALLPGAPIRDATSVAAIIFGTAAVAAFTPVECPYAELLAAICRLGETEFDEIRDKANAHILSCLSVWPNLRRPAATAALSRLSALACGAGDMTRGTVSSLLSVATTSWAGWDEDTALSLRKARLIRRSPAIVKRLPSEYHDATRAATAVLATRMLDNWVAPPAGDAAAASAAAAIGLEALAAICPLAAASFGKELVECGMLSVGAMALALAEGSADSGTPDTPRPPTLCADGSRAASQAPLSPSSLHWRVQLSCSAAAAISFPSALPPALPFIGETAMICAPPRPPFGGLWPYALTHVLSDSAYLRAAGLSSLTNLLASELRSRAGACSPPDTLATARHALANPLYVSQLIAAIAQNHKEGGGSAGSDGLMLQLTSPLGTIRVGRASRSALGGSITYAAHAILFQLLAQVIPESVSALAIALRQLVAPSAAPSGAIKGGAVGDVVAIATSSATSVINENVLSTLRARQATVAEAFAGFCRAAVMAAPLPPQGTTSPVFSPADADVSVALSAHASASLADTLHRTALELAAPIMVAVTTDWTSDWISGLSFISRGQDPSSLLGVTRFVFANAVAALDASGAAPPLGAADAASRAAVDSLILAAAGSTSTANATATSTASRTPAPTVSGTPPLDVSANLAAPVRWLSLASGLLREFLSASQLDAPAGDWPSATAAVRSAAAWGSVPIVSACAAPREAATALSRALLRPLLSAVGHPFKSCREEIARALSIVLSYPGSSNGGLESADAVTCALTALVGVAKLALTALPPTLASSDTNSSPSSSDDDAKELTRKWACNVVETVILTQYFTLYGDYLAGPRVVLALLPTLLDAQAVPDKEVVKLAGYSLASVAHSLRVNAFYGPAMTTALATIIAAVTAALEPPASAANAAAASAWFVRRGALAFLAAFRTRNLMAITRSADTRMRSLVATRLSDATPEVAEAAGTAYMSCVASLPWVARAAEAKAALAAAASAKPPPKVVATAPDAPAEAVAEFKAYRAAAAAASRARIAAIRLASAVVRAHPYDVPAFLPSVLAAIARHANDPAPIGTAAKKTIADFRASHSDAWLSHSSAFSESELHDVLAANSGASYYA